jgi:hypothetical protein
MTERRAEGALKTVERRMAAQRITENQGDEPADVVSWLVGVQGQEYGEAKWSVGLRTRGCSDVDVEAALDRGDILRTHVLRPTWHFVTPADVRWLLRLTRPRIHRLNASWYARSGLDPATLSRAHEILAASLADEQPRTRSELAARLSADGIHRTGLALGYLFMHAELEEVICSGPRGGGKQHTYTLLDRVAPPAAAEIPQGDDAVDELLQRYVRSRGPATVADFTSWSSLTVADTRQALQRLGSRLVCEHDSAGTARYSAPTAPQGNAAGGFLIPMYDELTISYRELRVVLAFPPVQGLERPIVVEGRTVGSWKRRTTARAIEVEAALFGSLTGAQKQGLAASVDAYGRFQGRPAMLTSAQVSMNRNRRPSA